MEEEIHCDNCGSIFTVIAIQVERDDEPMYCTYCGEELNEWFNDEEEYGSEY